MILLTMFRSSEILENHVKIHLAIDHTKVVTLSEKKNAYVRFQHFQ